jgi:hypothetical protein
MSEATFRFRLSIGLSALAIGLALLGVNRLSQEPVASGVTPSVGNFSNDVSTMSVLYRIDFDSAIRQDEALDIFCAILDSPSMGTAGSPKSESSGLFFREKTGSRIVLLAEVDSDKRHLDDNSPLQGTWKLDQNWSPDQKGGTVQVVLLRGEAGVLDGAQ